MSDIMLDLETLSTRPNAVIIVLAAIKFNRKGDLMPIEQLDTFYKRIDVKSCLELGLRADKNTIEWWKKQSPKIRYEALDHPVRSSLFIVLQEFKDWIDNNSRIWGNGDDFDCTILGEAYIRAGMEIPWKFYNTRDVRTIFDLAGITKYDLPDDNEHHALYDCYRQIVGVKIALKKLKL